MSKNMPLSLTQTMMVVSMNLVDLITGTYILIVIKQPSFHLHPLCYLRIICSVLCSNHKLRIQFPRTPISHLLLGVSPCDYHFLCCILYTNNNPLPQLNQIPLNHSFTGSRYHLLERLIVHIQPLQQRINTLSQSLPPPQDSMTSPFERELYVIILPYTDKGKGWPELVYMKSSFSRLFFTAVVTAGNPLSGTPLSSPSSTVPIPHPFLSIHFMYIRYVI